MTYGGSVPGRDGPTRRRRTVRSAHGAYARRSYARGVSDTLDADDRPAGAAGGRPVWLLVVGGVIAVYVAALAVIGVDDALEAVTDASGWPLAGAAVLQGVVVLMWAGVYGSSASAVGGDLHLTDALSVSMPAFTLSHTLPGGGWAGNALAVKRLGDLGLSGPAGTASVALGATISLTTIAALGASGIVTAVVAGDLPPGAIVIAGPALLILLGLVAAIIAVLHSPASGDRLVERIGRLHHRLEGHVQEWRSSLRGVTEDPPSAGALGRITGWALAKWAADIGALALVFLSFGQTPRISALLVGFGVTQLATAIPVTPGGVGFAESGMVGAFVALGYGLSIALAVVVTYRVVATWLPALAGVPYLLRRPAPSG
jgi:uncharacterized protein (TIRG00374 family)